MNFKGIIFFIGIYSLIVGFFSILNILYSIYFNFILDLNSYLFTFIISVSIGSIFCIVGKKHSKNISLSDQIILILLSFVFIPLLISFPYILSVYNISFLNSYFESISGFTSTGFSILENVDEVDEPLLIWRSSSQWIGGLFYLISIIGTLGSRRAKMKPIYLVAGDSFGGNFYNNFYYNTFKIFLIYFFSTIFIFFLFSLSNLRLLDSLNLALTIIPSGGFLHASDLSDIIKNDLQIFVLALSLLFPILNFYLFFKILTRRFKFYDFQEDIHLIIFVVFLTFLFYFFIISNENILNIFLGITSSIANSGISMHSSNFNLSLFFILLAIMGGSIISTSSGLKYVRFHILLKNSYHEIYRLVKPINIFNQNIFRSDIKITDEDSKISFLVFISFIFSIFVLSSILTFDNLNFEDSFKLSILTLTNTVTSSLYGIESLGFFNLSITTKLSLICFMILGKIEIIAFLYLIKKFIFKE